MLARPRFWLYRNVIALFTWLGFRSQKVLPLEAPVDGPVRFRPFADVFPDFPVRGLYAAETFPPGDHAESRLGRIAKTTRLLALVAKIAPRHTPPVPADEDAFLAVVYPKRFRRAWPNAPHLPAALAEEGSDVIAELAVGGAFASYLRRADDDGMYELDLSWIAGFDPVSSLARPGGKAVLAVEDGRLRTVEVQNEETSPTQAERAFLAGLNEHLTTFRHNLSVHLAIVTSFALASTNELEGRHPVRRLLHHCFNTVLIGNRELAQAQLSGPTGFAATIFSHDADHLVRMAEAHLGTLDFWDFEPDEQFRNRGTTETPFAYPYRDNVLQLWAATRDYVESYLELYYDGDEAVRKDAQLSSWVTELDRLVPNGVAVPIGGITFEWLARACATVIHVSTVEHDIVNNVIWNFSMNGWVIPTVAPRSGERMDQRRAFDLIATTIPTWKPYNMLLTADVPSLALDERGAAVMKEWIARLDRIQDEMSRQPHDPSLCYPANLNVSISN